MPTRVIVISAEADHSAGVAGEAVRAALGGAIIQQAVRPPSEIGAAAEPTLVIVCRELTPDEWTSVTSSSPDGLPSCAVILRGKIPTGAPNHAVAVDDSQWTVPGLSIVLPLAMENQMLRRENERFRGDLKAIAVRVAHDLRSPVNGIVSGVELVNDLLQRIAPQETGATSPIEESTDDLTKTIGQLSLWARIASTRIQTGPFEMQEVARRAREKFEARAHLGGAKLSAADSWPVVVGEPEVTEMVWRALIDNALRHAGERPEVWMEWEPAPGGFQFWVRDNGRGIDPRKSAALFHPFHRLHEPNAPRGLGLPIVERLVQMQSGRCEFRVVPSGGSSFGFYLPAAP